MHDKRFLGHKNKCHPQKYCSLCDSIINSENADPVVQNINIASLKLRFDLRWPTAANDYNSGWKSE